MAAARLLAAVADAHTPLDGLTDHENGHPQFMALDGRDRALVRAILSTALRFRVTIDRVIAGRLERPLPDNASVLRHILHVAVAQMLFLDIPDSAAVDLAVTHAKADPRTRRFAGLVNAVLRGVGRGGDALRGKALAEAVDAPDWFRARLAAAYGPATTAEILAAHRREAPVDFTVRSDPALWAERLGGIVLPTGSVRVAKLAGSVPDLPGFAEGAWWVQDAAASLPARLLGDVARLRVADLCAAPGGKTAQLALTGARVTAVDASKSRTARMAGNLARLKLEVECLTADIMAWTPAAPFDAILLDAPCSSTGTVRRHPDVPWTKSAADIGKLAGLQARLLQRAFGFLKPGGRLVFSNCSLDPEEGEALWAAFLASQPLAEAEPVRPDEVPGIAAFITPHGTLRTTPADMRLADPQLSGMDGFFAARARKRA